MGGGSPSTCRPPAGIIGLPPVGAGPSVPPAGETLAALGDAGERPAASGRAHPRRQHPRPLSGRASPEPRQEGAPEREGSPAPGSGGPAVHSPHRVRVVRLSTTPTGGGTPAARVRVPPVAVRVTPPAVRGRRLPEVEVSTPGVSATVDEAPQLRLR